MYCFGVVDKVWSTGPMPIPFTNGNKYMMTFVDDYTRMCWVYLLKNKSEAFETFKNFHAWIENDAQSHIGSIRIDNGKEYTSNEFENYLLQHGIKHKKIKNKKSCFIIPNRMR